MSTTDPDFYNKLAQLCQHYTIGRLAVADDSFGMPLHEKYWKEYVVLYDKNSPPNTNHHH